MDEQSKQDQSEDVEAHIAHRGKGIQDEDSGDEHGRFGGRARVSRDDGDDDVEAHIAHRGKGIQDEDSGDEHGRFGGRA